MVSTFGREGPSDSIDRCMGSGQPARVRRLLLPSFSQPPPPCSSWNLVLPPGDSGSSPPGGTFFRNCNRVHSGWLWLHGGPTPLTLKLEGLMGEPRWGPRQHWFDDVREPEEELRTQGCVSVFFNS